MTRRRQTERARRQAQCKACSTHACRIGSRHKHKHAATTHSGYGPTAAASLRPSLGRSRDSDNNLGPATVFTTLCSRLTDAADESYQARSRHRQQQHQATPGYSQGIATATAHMLMQAYHRPSVVRKPPQFAALIITQLTASAGSPVISKHSSHAHCPQWQPGSLAVWPRSDKAVWPRRPNQTSLSRGPRSSNSSRHRSQVHGPLINKKRIMHSGSSLHITDTHLCTENDYQVTMSAFRAQTRLYDSIDKIP